MAAAVTTPSPTSRPPRCEPTAEPGRHPQRGSFGDILLDSSGNDRLVGGLGADKLNASSGTGDVVAYEGRTARVVVLLDDLDNDGEAGEGDKITNAEIIQGGRGPDPLIGDDKANIFEGFDGDDVLIGGLGAASALDDLGVGDLVALACFA